MNEYLSQYFNAWTGRSPTFDLFLYFVQDTYLLKGLFVVCVLVALYTEHNTRERRNNIYATLILVLAGMVLAQLLQAALPYSSRPFNTDGLNLTLVAGLESRSLGQYGTSFPSDHAVMFSTIAACVLMYARKVGMALLVHALIVISLPRLILGYHWPTDLLGGALIGLSLAMVFQRPLAKWLTQTSLDDYRQYNPMLFYVLFFIALCETATMYLGLRSIMEAASDIAKAVS
jgi:undecaprenyl-diphosphatase